MRLSLQAASVRNRELEIDFDAPECTSGADGRSRDMKRSVGFEPLIAYGMLR